MTKTIGGVATALGLALAFIATGTHAEPLNTPPLRTLKVGGEGGWDLLSLDPLQHRLFIARSNGVSVVDLVRGTSVAHLMDANGGHIALPVHGGADILVTHGKTNLVTINDAKTGTLKANFTTGAKPDAAIVEPVTGLAVVMDNGATKLDIIDLKTMSSSGQIEVGGAPELAAVDGKGLVFTHLEDKNAFAVIDMRTRSLLATRTMEDCPEPSGLAFIAKGRMILSACHNGQARFSAADTGAEIAIFPIGQRPDGAIYDAKAERAYIPCGDATLTVFDLSGDQPKLLKTIKTAPGARQAVLDPDTGHLYLPTAEFGAPDNPGGKPSLVAGSFSILEFDKP